MKTKIELSIGEQVLIKRHLGTLIRVGKFELYDMNLINYVKLNGRKQVNFIVCNDTTLALPYNEKKFVFEVEAKKEVGFEISTCDDYLDSED